MKDKENKTQEEIIQAINKRFIVVGRSFFITNFVKLSDKKIADNDLIKSISDATKCSESSCRVRVRGCRILMEKYGVGLILEQSIQTKRLDANIIKIAKKHLKKHKKDSLLLEDSVQNTQNNKPVFKVEENKKNTNKSITNTISISAIQKRNKLQLLKINGIKMLPNFFTIVGLFFGFISIVLSMKNEHMLAMYCIATAGFFDGIDGRVARLTNSFSKFGLELDSIADMVSFGIAPAIFVLSGGLESSFGNIGVAISFFYAASAALRLARFNSLSSQKTFTGMPSPAAAGVVVLGWCFFTEYLKLDAITTSYAAAVLVVFSAIAMISPLSYNAFKTVNFNRRPFVIGIIIVVLLTMIIAEPLASSFFVFFIYSLIPILIYVRNKIKQVKNSPSISG
jgi:CDP-diacylglycerol--serine O-phosphatidyltransferase